MSEDSMLKCLIAFVLGYLVARMMRGNGLSVGGQANNCDFDEILFYNECMRDGYGNKSCMSQIDGVENSCSASPDCLKGMQKSIFADKEDYVKDDKFCYYKK